MSSTWPAYAAVSDSGTIRLDSICTDRSGVLEWQRAPYSKALSAERQALRIVPIIIQEATVEFKVRP